MGRINNHRSPGCYSPIQPLEHDAANLIPGALHSRIAI